VRLLLAGLLLSAYAQDGADPGRLLTPMGGGFKKKAGCPSGTTAVPTGSSFQPYRCVMGGPGAVSADAERLAGLKRYENGELSFQYPAAASLTDAWSDDPPSLYLVLESPPEGKPVAVFITLSRRGGAGYLPLEKAVRREREDLGALDGGRGTVAELPARFTKVGRESRTAYVAAGGGAYYTVAFSCPESRFDRFYPAYQRLLSTLAIGDGR
jgi:hypothetical protein